MVPLENPVLAGQSALFQVQGESQRENNIYWKFGDNSKVFGTSVSHTFSKPGVYHTYLYLETEYGSEQLSSAIVRVHTPETLELPQVFLDTDARNEADDQHYIAYALYSGLDVLGVNSIHNDQPGSEAINYGEIYYIQKLMNNSRVPWDSMSMHRVYHGAATKLKPPSNGIWSDSTSTVRLIWDIDGEAMKTDLFNTLGGRPTSLMPE